jgi:ribosomal protein S18 acetylase RimI-like enzyme
VAATAKRIIGIVSGSIFFGALIEHSNGSRMDADAELIIQQQVYSFGGIRSRSMSRYILNDAKRPGSPVVIVQQNDAAGRLIGMAVAIRDMQHYRIRMLLHFPITGFRVFCRHLLSRTTRVRRPQGEVNLPFPERWSTRGRDIAHILTIVVAPEYRKRGIASQLYADLFSELIGRGVTRVIARVGLNNASSLALHRRTGWMIGRDGSGWLCVKQL